MIEWLPASGRVTRRRARWLRPVCVAAGHRAEGGRLCVKNQYAVSVCVAKMLLKKPVRRVSLRSENAFCVGRMARFYPSGTGWKRPRPMGHPRGMILPMRTWYAGHRLGVSCWATAIRYQFELAELGRGPKPDTFLIAPCPSMSMTVKFELYQTCIVFVTRRPADYSADL